MKNQVFMSSHFLTLSQLLVIMSSNMYEKSNRKIQTMKVY